ncbi:hypothetical protein IGI37_000258 [Enterococcus sp. AZ194]|uniref:hypothetical protein n=1 Tax=Enterococcus sp. AZ194 TaxID=2774629 RepID=UPI003F287DA4
MKLDELNNEFETKELIINDIFVEEETEVEVSAVSSISTFGCMSGSASTASTWRP